MKRYLLGVLGLLAGLAVAGLVTGVEWYLTEPGPSEMPADSTGSSAADLVRRLRHGLSLLFGLAFLVMTVASAIGWLAAVVTRSARTRAWMGSATGFAIAAGLVYGAEALARQIRYDRFEAAAVALTPLTRAVTQYGYDAGRLPPTLGSLVPRYLERIDRFGVRGCRSPTFRHLGSGLPLPAWEVAFECPNGLTTVDRFYYRSDGEYRRGADLTRLGAWAYLRDEGASPRVP